MNREISKVKISIIIPLPKFNDYLREALKYYEKLTFRDFEIIILPDEVQKENLSEKLNIRIIPSGKVGPAEKRDLGAKYALGEIIAFTDDDAYPSPDWLSNAVKYFDDEQIAAVGGPAITPKNEKFWQKISGNVYESILMSGNYRKRYKPVGKEHEDYDIPSVNLIVRKNIFEKVEGFDSTFYPGEDTKLCLEIKKLNYKIIFDPKILVYHHRRALFPKHFQQIANYATHRGYFVKKFPETSKKLAYFLPSIFSIGIICGGILSFFSPILLTIYLFTISLYFILNIIANFRINLIECLITSFGVFLSHMTYGLFFLKGLMIIKDLKR
jgi:GT2 family glycosyltransferase